ncbi:MAG: hypothetical protein J6W10_06860, partial [Kiritimatiellae bacterium]|nr:hypothetical protein [Kiritimatiellia bacterium]
MRKDDKVRLVVAGVFAVSCAVISVPTAETFLQAFARSTEASVAKRLASARRATSSEFPQRLSFVTLNGLFVRASGQHLCNGVVKTRSGGMLFSPNAGVAKVKGSARRIKEFSDFCTTNGSRFLFVQLPRKWDVGD